jgi:chemotaxis protein CheD
VIHQREKFGLPQADYIGAQMDIVVDIADLQVTSDPTVTLVTHSLGSSLGVTVWDPAAHVGGLLHYTLPDSSVAPDKAAINPAMFADTGLPALFRAACELGAQSDRIVTRVAGGSSLLDDNGSFNIGKRNYAALRQILQQNGVLIKAGNVGGCCSRTLRLEIGTGRVTVLNHRDAETEL